MALCKDKSEATRERDFETLCPAGWHLCTPKQFNNRNDEWHFTPFDPVLDFDVEIDLPRRFSPSGTGTAEEEQPFGPGPKREDPPPGDCETELNSCERGLRKLWLDALECMTDLVACEDLRENCAG